MKRTPPGRITPGMSPEVVMMMCTAGHVDHGKTELVKLLTGCETDRLETEKERGLTIELGFAPCFLGGDVAVGIVDVPGHERFVKNMVAGVSGIELGILVIAADDGIMPQTVEHLEIMQLLGVKNGIVALTKIDLVTEERVQTLKDDIAKFSQGTFLEDTPIYPVSSVTFEGYEAFYNGLVERIKNIAVSRRSGIFRLPVERTFTTKGFGMVITGVATEGKISVGDTVEAVPGGQAGRVRGMQCFLRDAHSGGQGQCLALNIPDFTRTPPERGDVLCIPGYLKAATIFHLDISAVSEIALPIRNAEEIKFHTGTSECPGKIFVLEGKTLEGGSRGLVTVMLHEPIAAAVHDRVIIRRPSPQETVAGGEILGVSYGEQRPRRAIILDRLTKYRSFLGDTKPKSEEGEQRRVEWCLKEEMRSGGTTADIAKAVLLPPDVVKAHVDELINQSKVRAAQDTYFIHSEAYEEFSARATKILSASDNDTPTLSIPVARVRDGLAVPAPVWNLVEADLQEHGIVKKVGNTFVLKGAEDTLSPEERTLLEGIERIYRDTGFQSPRPAEIPEKLSAPKEKVERLLEHLYNEHRLIRLDKKVVLSREHLKKAQDMVVDDIKEHGKLDSGNFKNAIGSSRKYALAILDYLDARGVTIRTGNERTLAPDYEKYML